MLYTAPNMRLLSIFSGALALFAGLALNVTSVGFASFGSSSLFAGSRSQKLWPFRC